MTGDNPIKETGYETIETRKQNFGQSGGERSQELQIFSIIQKIEIWPKWRREK